MAAPPVAKTKKDKPVSEGDTQVEAAQKPPKVLLSPEEKRQRIVDARRGRLDAAFQGKHFEYVSEVHLEENERYTDVTGNKGRHGHLIRNTETGEELYVGPDSLQQAAHTYNAITLPEKPKRVRRTAEQTSDEQEIENMEFEIANEEQLAPPEI